MEVKMVVGGTGDIQALCKRRIIRVWFGQVNTRKTVKTKGET